MDLQTKLEILSDAAKYDVSCSSSSSKRPSHKGNLGSTANAGICHSFTPDGRCISLFKILLTNYCIYDCAYCLNRKSNTINRAAFTVDEVVTLTINFYRRNYIEGLFLSSGIIKSPDHTMEMLTLIVKKLRTEFGFGGYIHLKAIPGASPELIQEAGLYADRMSVNIELPSSNSLKLLAPDKHSTNILSPMKLIKSNILESKETRKTFKHSPLFVPGGQSTQMIVGASPESDLNILNLSENLYKKYLLKRVYYSAYMPINTSDNLPTIASPPTLREHRLYQSDWLLRLYGFKASEILDETTPNLDINFDPKTAWALRNFHLFPVEINKAPYEMLIRVPGIGIRGAQKIIAARKISSLDFSDLVKLRITLKRAQYFILCKGKYNGLVPYDEPLVRNALHPQVDLNQIDQSFNQLSLFDISSTSKPLLGDVNSTSKLLLLNDSHTSITGEL